MTGLLTWMGGDHTGKQKGRAEFISAVEDAASLVITRLEKEIDKVAKMHQECEEHKTILQARVDLLMKDGSVAHYHINPDREKPNG